MKPLEIEKPIIGQRTQIGKAFDEMVANLIDSNLISNMDEEMLEEISEEEQRAA